MLCDVITRICDFIQDFVPPTVAELVQRICEAILDFVGCGV